jgi:phospholipase/lecithinase/hemolysin
MSKFPPLFLCLALSLVLTTLASATDFSKFKHLVIFGDSLSDDGNAFVLTKGYPPFPYGSTFDGTGRTFPGRFTDGQIWVDYLPLVTRHVGAITAFYANPTIGTDVAVGGSTSANLLQQDPTGFPPAQIDDYVESKPLSSFPSKVVLNHGFPGQTDV